jgi:hypothetical protein
MVDAKTIRFCLPAVLLTIAAGLAFRRYGYDLGLAFAVVKYGGSLLWGSMVYFILAAVLSAFPPRISLVAAVLVAVSVEVSRLYHTAWMDAFRLTTAGALLLGRVFSLWNIVSYVCGILIACAVTRAAIR